MFCKIHEDPNAKATVLLLHGFGGSRHTLDDLADELKTRGGMKIIQCDAPGFGKYPGNVLDWQAAIDEYDELVSELSAAGEEIYIVGKSMGGGHAFSLCMRHPDEVNHCIAIAGLMSMEDLIDPNLTQKLHLAKAGVSLQKLAENGTIQEMDATLPSRMIETHPLESETHPKFSLVAAEDDRVVPLAQQEEIRTQLPLAAQLIFPAKELTFPHSQIDNDEQTIQWISDLLESEIQSTPC